MNAGDNDSTVDPSRPLKVSATGDEGKLSDVTAVDTAGRYVGGRLSSDGTHWHSTTPLAAGVRYTIRVSTENEDGQQGRRTLNFQTKPADARKLAVHFGPDSGTYGVAQPITAELSHEVTSPAQRKLIEGALRVTSTPSVTGSWHWVDGKELHYRPRAYWPAHTAVHVRAKLEGLRVHKGLYGGTAKPLDLKTGNKLEALADAGSEHMTVERNGKVLRTLPITTGKAGFRTRKGTKVILGRQAFVRMRSSTVGIGGGDSYDLGVHWATRLTWSGEFVHAAPWSVGSQGSANVSHGCTGLSNGDAEWFFNQVHPGDPVKFVHTGGKEMSPFDNGFGDWNLSWAKWQQGSALSANHSVNGQTDEAARLRPGL